MVTKIKNGRLILPGSMTEQPLYIENDCILSVGGDIPADRVIDAEGQYVSPGFVDIHLHGGGGCEFVDGTEDAVLRASDIHARHGTTTLFPTVSSYETDVTIRALDAVKTVRDREHLHVPDCVRPHIPGVHLEGPYFSPKQTGAQDPSHIRTPKRAEYEPILERYGDLIRRWSFAPELPGTDDFIDALRTHGILPAAGHTDAAYADVLRAHERGMSLITHLYSCTSTVTRVGGFRIPGVIESAYLLDGMDVEIIADGCHLPPELIRLIVKIKGVDRTCLVTDAIRYGGMDNVDHVSDPNGNVPYIIEDGVVKLADRSAFAGSIATMDRLVRVCVQKAGIPLTDAVRMASTTPARVMGLSDRGRIAPGLRADLVLLDDALTVTRVLIDGKEF